MGVVEVEIQALTFIYLFICCHPSAGVAAGACVGADGEWDCFGRDGDASGMRWP